MEKNASGEGWRGRHHHAIYSKLQSIADTYADEIRRTFPNIPRRVSGYSIDQLFAGERI